MVEQRVLPIACVQEVNRCSIREQDPRRAKYSHRVPSDVLNGDNQLAHDNSQGTIATNTRSPHVLNVKYTCNALTGQADLIGRSRKITLRLVQQLQENQSARDGCG